MAEALGSARRAVALDPLSPRLRNSLIGALAYSGYVDAARRELDGAAHLAAIRNAAGGRVSLSPSLRRPPHRASRGRGWGRQSLRPSRPRSGADARFRARPSRSDARQYRGGNPPVRPLASFWQLQTLGFFGRTEEAFAILLDPRRAPRLHDGPEVLFRHQLRSVRQDPRFMTVMARLGLV